METELFDPADFLESDEAQIEYVNAALETGEADFITRSLAVVARARGVAGLAVDAAPDFATVLHAMQTLGLRLTADKAA
jgi:DNA-binding phage protein